MTRATLDAVADLTADNRHTTAMYLTARHFGLRDLCAEFRAIHREHRLTRDLSDEANARRYAAFKEMRRWIQERYGERVWGQVKL